MNHEQAGCCRSRRAMLAGTGAVGVATLTGCATYGQPTSAPPPPPPPAANPSADPSSSGAPDAGGGPSALATLADIPVGGGQIYADAGVVITQPTAGTIKAYSATCTHQGCTVTAVTNGTIVCACHNSVFDIADGSVRSGPAGSPLPAANVSVDGDAIRLA
ncbi:Rieske (2Fe-2S) protein [Micromonospora craniellae]|uniref:Cytochrome bc1 complex Rieske iron-sulfur subunit n=1 Tax=Micromonospora craniellae TaxID=2294034 RepID=A0A372G0Q5_9ACTN|nr:Rieske (2Fe-2S) protein [Micromonospora craniellae]QOC91668.1 Rieske (2Fe-2S) protein [Micromonospora craniellae]RFS46553.1 Rieske (2Fe-2S) protein [Micromonospora craniellae]